MDVVEELIRRDMLERLPVLIAELPSNLRDVAELHFLRGLSFREIADRLKISVNAFYRRRAEALTILDCRLNGGSP